MIRMIDAIILVHGIKSGSKIWIFDTKLLRVMPNELSYGGWPGWVYYAPQTLALRPRPKVPASFIDRHQVYAVVKDKVIPGSPDHNVAVRQRCLYGGCSGQNNVVASLW